MPTVQRTDDEAGPALPDEAEAVIWAASSGDFRLGNPSDYPEECFPEEIDLSPVPARIEGETDPTVRYEAGEEFPLPVAEDLWPNWHDRMVALDSEGNRVDSSDGKNVNTDAVERWRMRNE